MCSHKYKGRSPFMKVLALIAILIMTGLPNLSYSQTTDEAGFETGGNLNEPLHFDGTFSAVDDSVAVNVFFSEASDTRITGYSPELVVWFSAVSENDSDTMLIEMGDSKTIKLGRNHRNTNFYVTSNLTDTGTSFVAQNEDMASINLLGQHLWQYRGYSALGDTLLDALTILSNWPQGVALSLEISDTKAQMGEFSMTREEFDLINTPAPTKNLRAIGEKVCDSIGKFREASFNLGGFVFGLPIFAGKHSSREFLGTKGLFRCNGRCGSDCAYSGGPFQPSDQGENIYTQDCFNHDICTIYYGAYSKECIPTTMATLDDTYASGLRSCKVPEIISVTPSVGVSGDTVEINGYFTDVKGVSFGVANGLEVPATTILSQPGLPGKIKVKVPNGTGKVSVFVDTLTNGRVEKVGAFSYTGTHTNIVRIKAKQTGNCLQVGGIKDKEGRNGDPIVQLACGNDREVWNLYNTGSGFNSIVNHYSGHCLDVYGGSGADGVNIIQWECHLGANQQWKLQPAAENGYYFVISKSSGKCLSSSFFSLPIIGKTQQLTCNGLDDQKWMIDPPLTPVAVPSYPLSVTISPNANSGNVKSSPSGIDCGIAGKVCSYS
jgi:hypothetical protein